jgi:hypothetical protein
MTMCCRHYLGSLTTPPCQSSDKGYVRVRKECKYRYTMYTNNTLCVFGMKRVLT